jgi:phage shock protein A
MNDVQELRRLGELLEEVRLRLAEVAAEHAECHRRLAELHERIVRLEANGGAA